MAQQTFYLGSVGPLFYDDEDVPEGFSGSKRLSLMDSTFSGIGGGVSPGDQVVTDVSLSIDFEAKTFSLTVTKQPLGNPLAPNEGP